MDRSPGGVAVREREVAGMVGADLPDRAIADRLVLSERTAETHVRNLPATLGLTDRTRIAG